MSALTAPASSLLRRSSATVLGVSLSLSGRPDPSGPAATWMIHMFDMRCNENRIEHRLTKIKHPWTNGQVERMNRTIKEATVKRYHYDSHAQLTAHLRDFIDG
jgi:transposase InsO family protein